MRETGHRLAEVVAVCKPSQGIHVGEADDLHLGIAAIRDVAQRPHESAIRKKRCRNFQDHPVGAATVVILCRFPRVNRRTIGRRLCQGFVRARRKIAGLDEKGQKVVERMPLEFEFEGKSIKLGGPAIHDENPPLLVDHDDAVTDVIEGQVELVGFGLETAAARQKFALDLFEPRLPASDLRRQKNDDERRQRSRNQDRFLLTGICENHAP